MFECGVCEGDACMYKYVFLWLEKTVQVPNRSVTYAESDYFDVNIVGLLADCAPSLSLGDIATHAKSCDDVEWKYRRACNYRKNGWLGEDGVTVKDTLDKDFDEIAGVSKNILKCLGWDGVDDYFDYYYDYYGNYDYDYDYLEESGAKEVRQKREVQSNIPEFLIQGNHSRKKRSSTKRNQKRKQQNKQKGSKRSKGGNRKAGRKGRRKIKREKNHKNKHGQRSSEKKRKTSRKNQKRRKKIERNLSKINRKKDKKAKQEKKKEGKILKKIAYKAMPSKEVLNKLRCVERA